MRTLNELREHIQKLEAVGYRLRSEAMLRNSPMGDRAIEDFDALVQARRLSDDADRDAADARRAERKAIKDLLKQTIEGAEKAMSVAEGVKAAFKALDTLNDVDRGIAQHVLLKALREPNLATHVSLAQAVKELPHALRNPQESCLPLTSDLVEIAKKDQRFLDNFLAGMPPSPFW